MGSENKSLRTSVTSLNASVILVVHAYFIDYKLNRAHFVPLTDSDEKENALKTSILGSPTMNGDELGQDNPRNSHRAELNSQITH